MSRTPLSDGPTEFPTGPAPRRRMSVRDRLRRSVPGVIALGALAGLWQLSSVFLSPVATPSLTEIWSSMQAIVTDWAQLENLVRTGVRILIGLLLAFAIGMVPGVLMGFSEGIRTYLRPILYFVQGIPALSWVVFAVLWFTDAEVRIAFILVMVTFPNFSLFVEGAVRGVPQELRELGHAFRASRWNQFRQIVLPAITPAILSSWAVNLGNGVRAVVVAELVGATVGVGNRLLLAQSLFNMADAMAWTLLLVLMLLLFQTVLNLIESRLLAWRPVGERR
ncbi:ABC transporter permease subunit [Nocardioides carbamazepini]|nr:ABC transporter permease subunit [Nocardioides carbamazepini]